MFLLMLSGCGKKTQNISSAALSSENDDEEVTYSTEIQTEDGGEKVDKINVQIGGRTFRAVLEDNQAAEEFLAIINESPLELCLSDYSGFEKVGNLGRSLTPSNKNITANSGDIVLYNGNQIVVFYGSNSWSYTKLAHIYDLTGWKEAMGTGDITIVFEPVQ